MSVRVLHSKTRGRQLDRGRQGGGLPHEGYKSIEYQHMQNKKKYAGTKWISTSTCFFLVQNLVQNASVPGRFVWAAAIKSKCAKRASTRPHALSGIKSVSYAEGAVLKLNRAGALEVFCDTSVRLPWLPLLAAPGCLGFPCWLGMPFSRFM